MRKQRAIGALMAVLIAVFVGAFRYLSLTGFSNDHYVHLAAGQQIAMGEWPSRDFVELGLPLMEFLSAIPFWVVPGAPLFGEAVLVAVMFALGAVLTLYAARRLTGSWWIALLVVALEVVIVPRTYSYPKVLAYGAGFLAMWRYVERPTWPRLFQLAAVVVLAFGLRHDHGVYLGFGALLTVAAVALTAGRGEVWRRAAALAGCVLLLLLPYVVHVAVHDGLWRHIVRGLDQESVESARGRSIPGFTLDADFVAANAVPWLFFVFHLLPLVAAAAAWLRWREHPDPGERAMVVPLVIVAVLANVGLIRDTLAARLPDAVVSAALLLGLLIAYAAKQRPSPVRPALWVAAAAVVVLTLASAVSVGATHEHLEKAEMLGTPSRLWDHVHRRTAELHERLPATQIPSHVVAELLPFFEYVDRCLSSRDHVLIPGFAPEVPVWARRPFAGGQVWFQAELLARDDDHRAVMSRLAVQRVPVAITLGPSSDAVVARFPELGRYLRDNFPETVTLDGDEDERATIAFSARLAKRRDSVTGWYCYR